MLFNKMEGKRIVSGWYRGMRREHGCPASFLERFVEARAALGQVADPLQHDKRRMSLVEVEHRWIRAERLQHADAADAQNDFLLDARFAVAAVEPRRQLAVPRRVLLQIRVEQVQLDATDPDAPHRYEY